MRIILLSLPRSGAKRWLAVAPILLGLAFAASAGLFPLARGALRPAAGALAGWRIVVDPGHGGIDGGTNRQGLMEKDIVLDVGLKLAQFLRMQGAQVFLTRDCDMDVTQHYQGPARGRHSQDLGGRVQFTARVKGDLMVSLHVNSSSDPATRGPSIYYGTRNPHSRRLAELIYEELGEVHTRRSRFAIWPGRGLYVPSRVEVPMALVELAYISSPADRQLLTDENFRYQAALAIGRGIARFCAGMGRRTPAGTNPGPTAFRSS
ncbi:MAG: N-acetylmuramoyl-L-alanine amidase [Firmicutes bacterium]|nr:N-acetylmuramoyl-L-alanine amidase [Bacillota bacterium]